MFIPEMVMPVHFLPLTLFSLLISGCLVFSWCLRFIHVLLQHSWPASMWISLIPLF